MAAPRRVIEISIGATEFIELEAIARSRTEWACRVQRARILLAYHANASTYAVGEAIGVTHQTVQRCLDRAVRFGVMAALDDSPRPGKEPTITGEAKAWVVALACQKSKELGHPHELWTTRLLARHIRDHAEAAGHPCLTQLAQGTIARSSVSTTCNRIRSAIISSGATMHSSRRWRRCCACIVRSRSRQSLRAHFPTKPGRGLLPSQRAVSAWCLSRNGSPAETVVSGGEESRVNGGEHRPAAWLWVRQADRGG